MRLFKIMLVHFTFLLLIACNNNPNKSSSDKPSLTKGEQPTEPAKKVTDDSLDLTKYGIANFPKNILGGLQVGDPAPDFSLPDQDGKEVNLKAVLQKGPVLLVFLRAEWCSFCVKHLKEFQDHIQEINDAGQATVIAVSPQQSSYMKEFHDENQFSFPILFDDDHVVMKDYKVFFRVTEKYNNYIKEAKGHRIEVYNGDTNAYMPVPATYLIDQNKIIKYVHYDPDYKKRSDLKEVIAQLEE